MHRILKHWCFHAEELCRQFHFITSFHERIEDCGKQINTEASSLNYDAVSIQRFNELRDIRDQSKINCADNAGHIMIVLNSLLTEYKLDLYPKGSNMNDLWRNTEPLFSGYSVGAIYTAAANHYRYYNSEWATTEPPNKRQLDSIRIIAAGIKCDP